MRHTHFGDYDPDEQLSAHFTLRDLTVTNAPPDQYPNIPDEAQLANLRILAKALEVVYTKVGPFRIASAFRSQAVQNWIIHGGAGSTAAAMAVSVSYHTLGIAADVTPESLSVEEFFTRCYAIEAVRAVLGQIVNKAEGGQQSVHLSLPTDKFPEGTLMRVGEGGQYYRLTGNEISDYLENYPVTITASLLFITLLGASTYWIVTRIKAGKPIIPEAVRAFVRQPG